MVGETLVPATSLEVLCNVNRRRRRRYVCSIGDDLFVAAEDDDESSFFALRKVRLSPRVYSAFRI